MTPVAWTHIHVLFKTKYKAYQPELTAIRGWSICLKRKMNEIISRSLQILPPGEQVRKTASFSFSTAYFSVEESEQRCVDTQVRRLCSTDWLTAWCVHVIRWCLQSRGLQVEATPRMVCVWDRFIQTFDRKTSLMYKLFKTNIIRRVHEHSVQISKAPFSSMYCIWCRLFFLNKKNYKMLFLFFFQPGWLWQKKKKKNTNQTITK